MFDLPVIINALNIANIIDTIRSTLNNTNNDSIINALQTKHLYHVLKCSALPKQPLLIMNVNIIIMMFLIGKSNDLPIKNISIVSAILKIKLHTFLFVITNFFILIIHHLSHQRTKTKSPIP